MSAKLKAICILLFCFFQFPLLVSGQGDSTYYEDYTSQITGRFYFSQKYTSLIIDNKDDKLDLTYRPNTTFNMGIGASYDWFTLNLAYGFGFLNQDEERGETEYLDLQAHFYGQKLNLDLFGEFYNGFYLHPKGKASTDDSFYLRPDLKISELGASVQYVFNDTRYSLRAASIQTQRQRKSAGSILAGVEFYFGVIRADSSIYPSMVKVDTLNNNQADFLEIGPNIGYGYTLVFLKNFYLSASLSANLDYGITNYYNDAGSDHSTGISPNAMVRIYAGYNTPKNAFSITYINNKVSLSPAEHNRVAINTGNYRINYVRRFVPGPKTVRFLKSLPIF